MTNTNTNDWNARILKGAKNAMAAEAKGMGSVARYVRDDVAPCIGMRVQEGAYAWRVDSDEAVAQITMDIFEQAGINSVKGLTKGSEEYVATRNAQSYIRRAITLYRNCTVLAEMHNEAADWAKTPEPSFPLVWFLPIGVSLIESKGLKTHAPMSGKAKVGVLVTREDAEGNVEADRVVVTISEARINSLVKPIQKREQAEDSDSSDMPESLGEAVVYTSKLLAAADYTVSGEVADDFLALIEAFAAASESNRAALLGIVTEAQKASEVAKAA